MVASIAPHRDELGLGDGLMLIDGRWVAAVLLPFTDEMM